MDTTQLIRSIFSRWSGVDITDTAEQLAALWLRGKYGGHAPYYWDGVTRLLSELKKDFISVPESSAFDKGAQIQTVADLIAAIPDIRLLSEFTVKHGSDAAAYKYLDSPEVGEHSKKRITKKGTTKKAAPKKAASAKRTTPTPKKLPSPVQFTVYHPKELGSRNWQPLVAYVHTQDAIKLVEADARKELGAQLTAFGKGKGAATETIRRGAEITIIPHLPGCRFNPAQQSLFWEEDWHRANFRCRSESSSQELTAGAAVNGTVSFFVGPVLVGTVAIWTHLSEESSADSNTTEFATTETYESIFVSYSHDDAIIVDMLEKAYEALGMQYLRDVKLLRSGQKWNAELLRKIDEADIFQLCWSAKAKRSPYVEQEWRHAWARSLPNFIRPIYWQKPLPEPPAELRDLHFGFYKRLK